MNIMSFYSSIKMNKIKHMQTRVPMKPSHLGLSPVEYIMTTLKTNREYLTTKSGGHVVEIIKIDNYHNEISNVTENIIWTVDYTARVVLPRVGDVLKVLATILLTSGMLCNFHGIKVWVPEHLTGKYRFISNTFSDGEDQIRKDDEINVIVTTVRYDKKAFSCIARLET